MYHFYLPAWLRSIHHDGSEEFVSNPCPQFGEHVHLRLRAAQDAPLAEVYLRFNPDGEQSFIRMQPSVSPSPVCWWECDLQVTQPVVNYRFLLISADGLWFYNAAGVSSHDPLDQFDFRLLAEHDLPEWVPQSVFYQIFPDRFANGDPSNDPQPTDYEYRGHRPVTYAWGERHSDDQPFPLVFYGGDLAGIAQRLDHLQDLGVNALYINPVFHAHSNHKYDVIDYEHVDPHLGGDQALVELRRALDRRAMRYILDIVPNHCGYWHSWFQTARRDPQSVEADFFTFLDHPDDYVSWLGVRSLPKLNYRSAELRRRIYEDPQAIVRRWLRQPYRADGWRVDVANMLGRQGKIQMGIEIAAEIRRAVKQVQPDAYLIGENFFDATAQLQGDQWDGVMNYAGLMYPLLDWLRGYQRGAHGFPGQISSPRPWTTDSLVRTWADHMAVIPWEIVNRQYNLLGSHDTPRIRSVLNANEALQRLAVIVQFTYPGVPGIYYGDEIGMQEHPQLGPRGCMPWDPNEWAAGLWEFYRSLIALRRRSPVLQRGGFQMLAVENDWFAYQRQNRSDHVIVVAQRSEQPQPGLMLDVANGGIADGAFFVEHFTHQEVQVKHGKLSLPEHLQGATLWVRHA